jgi:hypothetical protein
MTAPAEHTLSLAWDVRRLAQYRPFDRGGLDLRAVLHDLVLAVAAIEDGAITSLFDCRKAFLDCWALEVEVDELRPIMEGLIDRGDATKEGQGFRLSPALMADLEARARDWDQTEERAFREWELSVRHIHPGLDADAVELLYSDLRDWLHLIIRRHGAEAALMLYPEDERSGRFFDDVEAQGFDALPERPEELARLREQALPLFIRAPTPDQRRFLARLLNVGFYMTVLTIDPTARKLVQEQMTGHRLYLDTNFLYAVFGGAPAAEVYSSRRLLQMSRELGFQLAVTSWTMDELRTSIGRSRREIEEQKAFVRTELADAMLRSSGDKGFNRLFWETYKKDKAQPTDFFDRLEHFDHELERYGIQLIDEGCHAIDGQEERIRDYASLLYKERWPYTKDWVVLEHDAKSRLLVERLRGNGNVRLSNARCWFLTYDAKLPRFARHVPENGDAAPDLPFCVSPSAWVQILRALTPRTEDFESTVVDLLTSPYLGYRAAVNPAVVQQVVGRMDHYEDASPELAITILADTAKVHEIEQALAADDEEVIEEAVHAAYSAKARELEETVAASVHRAEKLDRERRAAEARAEEADAAHSHERKARSAAEEAASQERAGWEAERRALEDGIERANSAPANQELAQPSAEAETRIRVPKTALLGAALMLLGLAVAVALPLALVSGKWAVAGAVVGGAALILLGLRVLVGASLGGEIAKWLGVLAAIAAIVVTIVANVSPQAAPSPPGTTVAPTRAHSK